MEVECDNCGRTFYKSPSKVKRTDKDYCSNECKYEDWRDYDKEEILREMLHEIEGGATFNRLVEEFEEVNRHTLRKYTNQLRREDKVELDSFEYRLKDKGKRIVGGR